MINVVNLSRLPGEEKEDLVRSSHEHDHGVLWGLQYEILKKIRKMRQFEVLIFYYEHKRKWKNKELPNSLIAMKRFISNQEISSGDEILLQ
jgi:hypothetical protein